MGIDTMLEAEKMQMKSRMHIAGHRSFLSEVREMSTVLDLVQQETKRIGSRSSNLLAELLTFLQRLLS